MRFIGRGALRCLGMLSSIHCGQWSDPAKEPFLPTFSSSTWWEIVIFDSGAVKAAETMT